MRIVVVGRAVDLRGFALAGVETVVCRTPTEVEPVVSRLGLRPAGVGLLILSPWAAALGRQATSAIRASQGPPVVLELPGDAVEDED
jgi:vacuolar-type H+-ATPase subunit F/Vma7